jgi:hypothetical protein
MFFFEFNIGIAYHAHHHRIVGRLHKAVSSKAEYRRRYFETRIRQCNALLVRKSSLFFLPVGKRLLQ